MHRYKNRKGNRWDNALMEILWGSLKESRLYGMRFKTRCQAIDEVIDYIDYYHRRLHSSLNYISPKKFEQNWFMASL